MPQIFKYILNYLQDTVSCELQVSYPR